MNSLPKLLSYTFCLLFCVGAIVSAYILHSFPEDLIRHSRTIDLLQVRQLAPLLNQLNIVLGGTLALGMLAITLTLLNRRQNMAYQSASKGTAEKTSEAFKTGELEQQELQLQGIAELLQSSEEQAQVFNRALSLICKQIQASQAAAYLVKKEEAYRFIELFASFAHHLPEGDKITFRFGEGLAGQAAKEGKTLNIKSVPQGYLQIVSGLGKATPSHLLVVPVKKEGEVAAVVEIASFHEFTAAQESAIQQSLEKLSLKLGFNDNVSLAGAKR